MARSVQHQLLPKATREICGLDLAAQCVPAWELGGDFYDFLPYGCGRVGLVLGDVSGKGIAAALLGALTIGILRAQTVEKACPSEMLAWLDNRIREIRLDARFVAMLFAVFDVDSQQLTIANAGNPHPILLRNGRLEEILVSGIPLGLFACNQYEVVSLKLQAGDVVVFASDGIFECQSRKEEVFGTKHLEAVLASLPPDVSAEGIASAILCETDAFSGRPSVPHDDRSLVVLRVSGNSGRASRERACPDPHNAIGSPAVKAN
jgi:sigma-B regulation protein RsbU (phosphoserine phosphatase)